MRIWCVSAQRNELPTAEVWGRHACRLFDRVCVVDTGSTDGTRRVYELLRDERLPISIFTWAGGAIKPVDWEHHDHVLRWGMCVAMTTGDAAPDAFDFSDGDEWPEFTYNSLRKAVAEVPRGKAPLKTLDTFLPTPDGYRAQVTPVDETKCIAPWWSGRCYPVYSSHQARAYGCPSPMEPVRIGKYAHVPIRGAENAIVKIVQQYPLYPWAREMLQKINYDPARLDTFELARMWYGGSAETDPASRVPFEDIEIRYPEYQQTHMLEALAGAAGVDLAEARQRWKDHELTGRLAEQAYRRFDRFRDLMWSEAM